MLYGLSTNPYKGNAMNRRELIAILQSNHKAKVGQGENVFIPMAPEQSKARKVSFIEGLKANMFKLEARASFK